MATYDMQPVVHTEVIQTMSPQDKERLMDELAELMQNQSSYVTVASGGGFSKVWRVLTGKQSQLHTSINLSQTEINSIIAKMLIVLQQDQVHMESDIQYLKRMVALLTLFSIATNQALKDAGIPAVDTAVLESEAQKQLESAQRALDSERDEHTNTPTGLQTSDHKKSLLKRWREYTERLEREIEVQRIVSELNWQEEQRKKRPKGMGLDSDIPMTVNDIGKKKL